MKFLVLHIQNLLWSILDFPSEVLDCPESPVKTLIQDSRGRMSKIQDGGHWIEVLSFFTCVTHIAYMKRIWLQLGSRNHWIYLFNPTQRVLPPSKVKLAKFGLCIYNHIKIYSFSHTAYILDWDIRFQASAPYCDGKSWVLAATKVMIFSEAIEYCICYRQTQIQ